VGVVLGFEPRSVPFLSGAMFSCSRDLTVRVGRCAFAFCRLLYRIMVYPCCTGVDQQRVVADVEGGLRVFVEMRVK
jgi:hypothetical protein